LWRFLLGSRKFPAVRANCQEGTEGLGRLSWSPGFLAGADHTIMLPMVEALGQIERALAVVQKTLDALVSRGNEEAAYELARAQFAASMRASWPANLLPMVAAMQVVADNTALKLDDAERAALREAMETFRRYSPD
jgi:hypothetical protein